MKILKDRICNDWIEFSLINDNGMTVKILNFGGIISQIIVPDQHGKMENIVLGYKNIVEYRQNPNYFGAIVGRVAGRIKNAAFPIGQNIYSLSQNEGKNHLHGGPDSFSHMLWDTVPFESKNRLYLKMRHTSPDGVNGYPGTLHITVTYELNNANQLLMTYQAETDQVTPIALTNHTYFNLTGNLKNTIQEHELKMNCGYYLELDNALLPTGKILPVMTPFDFRNGRRLQEGIVSGTGQNRQVGNGYDHYFLFDETMNGEVYIKDPVSKRTLHIETNQPGVVLYTANGLTRDFLLREGPSRKYLGVCFETQGPPASLHHRGLPSIFVHPDKAYLQKTTYTFGCG